MPEHREPAEQNKSVGWVVGMLALAAAYFGWDSSLRTTRPTRQKRTSARRGDRFSVADGLANELDVSRSCGLGAVLARAQSPATPGGRSL